MSETRRHPAVIDVASISEFVKGYQQQGLKRALVFAAPFAVDRVLRAARRDR
jgi:hypothetical protein